MLLGACKLRADLVGQALGALGRRPTKFVLQYALERLVVPHGNLGLLGEDVQADKLRVDFLPQRVVGHCLVQYPEGLVGLIRSLEELCQSSHRPEVRVSQSALLHDHPVLVVSRQKLASVEGNGIGERTSAHTGAVGPPGIVQGRRELSDVGADNGGVEMEG